MKLLVLIMLICATANADSWKVKASTGFKLPTKNCGEDVQKWANTIGDQHPTIAITHGLLTLQLGKSKSSCVGSRATGERADRVGQVRSRQPVMMTTEQLREFVATAKYFCDGCERSILVTEHPPHVVRVTELIPVQPYSHVSTPRRIDYRFCDVCWRAAFPDVDLRDHQP